jgi:hypothetical protein
MYQISSAMRGDPNSSLVDKSLYWLFASAISVAGMTVEIFDWRDKPSHLAAYIFGVLSVVNSAGLVLKLRHKI